MKGNFELNNLIEMDGVYCINYIENGKINAIMAC